MKGLVNVIRESLEFPMQGVLKKGDEVTILWLDSSPLSEDPKIINTETAKVQKVISKDLGRYSGDQHTWAYVNDIRYELLSYMKDKFLGEFDYDCSKNPRNKHAIICTAEQAEDLNGPGGKLNLNI